MPLPVALISYVLLIESLRAVATRPNCERSESYNSDISSMERANPSFLTAFSSDLAALTRKSASVINLPNNRSISICDILYPPFHMSINRTLVVIV